MQATNFHPPYLNRGQRLNCRIKAIYNGQKPYNREDLESQGLTWRANQSFRSWADELLRLFKQETEMLQKTYNKMQLQYLAERASQKASFPYLAGETRDDLTYIAHNKYRNWSSNPMGLKRMRDFLASRPKDERWEVFRSGSAGQTESELRRENQQLIHQRNISYVDGKRFGELLAYKDIARHAEEVEAFNEKRQADERLPLVQRLRAANRAEAQRAIANYALKKVSDLRS